MMNIKNFESLQHKEAPASLFLDIGELVFRIDSDARELFRTATGYYAAFVTSKRNPDFTIDVFTHPGPAPAAGPGRVPFSVKQTIDQNKSYIQSPYFKGFADKDRAQAKLVCMPNDVFSWLEHFFRHLYAWLLPDYDGCIFHGAGLVRHNQGFIFFGPGGAGKSTVTQLSPHCAVLGDDLIILRRINNRFYILGAPFNIGSQRTRIVNQKTPVHSIYRLRQDKNNFIQPADHSIAAAELMSNVPVIHQDPGICGRIFIFMEQLLRKTPYFDLYFTKDNHFWKVIDEHFGKTPQKR